MHGSEETPLVQAVKQQAVTQRTSAGVAEAAYGIASFAAMRVCGAPRNKTQSLSADRLSSWERVLTHAPVDSISV